VLLQVTLHALLVLLHRVLAVLSAVFFVV
jgi:hypothetical protein